MKINITSLMIGWFAALILLWLVVSLNGNANSLSSNTNLLNSNVTSLNKEVVSLANNMTSIHLEEEATN